MTETVERKTMSEKITLLGDWILLAPTKPAEKTDGGIYKPETATGDPETPRRGTVVAAGRGRIVDGVLNPIDQRIKTGCAVLYKTGSDASLKDAAISLNGEDLVLVREEALCGIVEPI